MSVPVNGSTTIHGRATGRRYNWAPLQVDAVLTKRRYNWAPLQVDAVLTGRGYNWTPLFTGPNIFALKIVLPKIF